MPDSDHTHDPGHAASPSHDHAHPHHPVPVGSPPISGVLGWPAWQRVLVVLPLLVLLWLAVGWASAEVQPW
ncbi:hypothetical protein [Rhodoferax sp.]|uniref:hypothetical protein n=1 Tax=Rhodoferax sp. TaxID=50421 RepID=UPI002623FDFA|nr:hypothetical protein [Rhodoferax sp.]MDD2924278.1 hypothetical protein [Rhodoferax sp.]